MYQVYSSKPLQNKDQTIKLHNYQMKTNRTGVEGNKMLKFKRWKQVTMKI